MSVTDLEQVTCGICTLAFVPDVPKRKMCPVCRELDGDAFKAVNQLHNAFKLAQVLIAKGASPVDVMHGPPALRRFAEEAAGVGNGRSPVTWAMVCKLMSGKPE